MNDYQTFALGNVVLQSGATIRDAQLAYKTFGTLSPKKDNVIVCIPPGTRLSTRTTSG